MEASYITYAKIGWPLIQWPPT